MKILVIGDSCTDIFVYGNSYRLCPEAPVPIFEPSRTVTNDGMAGNVKANLESLGAKVELITNREQITKTRYVDNKSNQMFLRVDSLDRVKPAFDINRVNWDVDAVIVSDYDKGFLTESDIYQISKKHSLTFIDTKKPINLQTFSDYTYVKMNEYEWELCEKNGAKYEDWSDKLIITMSERGCLYKNQIFPVNNDIEVRDLSGAGDTFMAGLTIKYLETKNVKESIQFANICASKVVQKKGVVTL
jgi:D-beta-D-heptose 7-phosphate kinase/D-beta-D-heptose 1-phosphate adenosyltransferase